MQAKQFRKKGNHNRPTSCSDKNSHCVKGFSSNRYPEHQKGWFNEHQCWVTDVIFKRSSGEGVTLQEDKLTESDSRTGKWKVNWPCLNFSLTWIPSDDACRKVANLYWKTQVLNHGTAATVPVLRKFWSFWRCLYTNLLPQWLSSGFDPRSTTSMIVFRLQLLWESGLNNRPFSIGAIRRVETKQFMDSSGKFCPRVIDSDKPSPMLWPWSSLPVPHSKYKQKRAKESEPQPSKRPLTTACIIVGLVQLLVVVKVSHQPTCSFLIHQKLRNKERKLQPSTTKMVVVCNCTFLECPP